MTNTAALNTSNKNTDNCGKLKCILTKTTTTTKQKNDYCFWRWGKREIMYLSLLCHHQNDFCIKMGSDESHFKVSLIVRDKVIRQCPQTTSFLKRKDSRSGIDPMSFCLLASRLTARPNRLTSERRLPRGGK